MKLAILALLTQGPAYGLQIRNELERRIEREKPINVGQVYATIDRLSRDGYVVVDEHTDDGLPLYTLSETGKLSADEWLRTPIEDPLKPWESMLTQVLMAVSLPGVDQAPLIEAYQETWQLRRTSAEEQSTLGSRSRVLLANAALSWLETVTHSAPPAIPVSQVRPPRGRPRS